MSTMYKQFGGTTTIESSESESEDDTTNFDHLFGSSVCGTILYSCLLDLAFVVRSEKKELRGKKGNHKTHWKTKNLNVQIGDLVIGSMFL